MRRLLAADRVRFGRRRDVWILVGLVPFAMALIFMSEFRGLTTPPDLNVFDPSSPPDPAFEAEIRAQIMGDFHAQLAREIPAFAFPASLLKVVSNPIPAILLAIYLATALVAGEFEWGTVRTLHLTSSRAATLAVRLGVVAGLVAVAIAIGLVFAMIAPFLLSVEGVPLQQYGVPTPNLLADIGAHLLFLLPFIAIPALAAVVARSTGIAFLLTILFFVVDLAVTGTPFWSDSPVPWIPAVTFSGAATRLLGGDTNTTVVVPGWVSLCALIAWAAVPAAAAVGRFRRLDLNE